LPHRVWGQLNLAWAVFFAILGVVNLFVAFNYTTEQFEVDPLIGGVVNLFVAFNYTTNQWVNFKLFGATGCLLVFIVAQSLWLAKYMKEDEGK